MKINGISGSYGAANATADPGRRAGLKLPKGTMAVPVSGNVRDTVMISAQIQDTPAEQKAQVNSAAPADAVSGERAGSGGTTFTSFAEQFDKITKGYTDTIREHYAAEHEENLTYDSPSTHIWNKYKNPDSPDFRSDLSEDERAWAYDQELDLLSGGRHLQMRNPYAFADAGGPPTLASAAMQAIQACREQIDQSIRDIFAESEIEIPADASFRLTADQPDYIIHVTGLEDEELTKAIEQALNWGDNGKNLYDHLKLTASDSGDLGVDYANGHLVAVDTRQELDDKTLSEVKKQAGPTWARYSSTYNPHQEAMNEKILGLDPDSPFNTQENKDRISAAVRVGAPEIIAEFRAQQQDMSLVISQNREIDPDGSIALETYWRAYVQTAIDAREAIKEYYAEAHAENSAYPFMEGLDHIAEKYKWPWSDIFRADLTEDQRNMYYRQERALLTGARLTLLDPYALASVGGVLNVQTSHQLAMQAVREKLDELRRNIEGTSEEAPAQNDIQTVSAAENAAPLTKEQKEVERLTALLKSDKSFSESSYRSYFEHPTARQLASAMILADKDVLAQIAKELSVTVSQVKSMLSSKDDLTAAQVLFKYDAILVHKARTEGLTDTEKLLSDRLERISTVSQGTFNERMQSIQKEIEEAFQKENMSVDTSKSYAFHLDTSTFTFSVTGGTEEENAMIADIINKSKNLLETLSALYGHRREDGQYNPWAVEDSPYKDELLQKNDVASVSKEYSEKMKKLFPAWNQQLQNSYLKERYGFGLDDIEYAGNYKFIGKTAEITELIASMGLDFIKYGGGSILSDIHTMLLNRYGFGLHEVYFAEDGTITGRTREVSELIKKAGDDFLNDIKHPEKIDAPVFDEPMFVFENGQFRVLYE